MHVNNNIITPFNNIAGMKYQGLYLCFNAESKLTGDEYKTRSPEIIPTINKNFELGAPQILVVLVCV